MGSSKWENWSDETWTNLNVGTGDPWAGQDRLRLSDCEWEYRDKSVVRENWGLDPPIGSTSEETFWPMF